SLRLRGLSPRIRLLKENSRKRTKNADRARSQARCSNTFVTAAMEEPIDLPRSAWGRPLKWLKEYDRVANFNKWMT
ncbi:hypothetical protein TNCV_2169681, partial [Trichonephila clavipes]